MALSSTNGAGPERTRVLYVVGNFVAGGAERHLLEMWSRIDRSRFEVEIACIRARDSSCRMSRRSAGPSATSRSAGGSTAPRTGSGSRGSCTTWSFRPQVIHGYLFGPNLLAALAGRLAACPRWCREAQHRRVRDAPADRGAALRGPRATHVTSVSEAVAETSWTLGVPRERITVIPNGVDVRDSTPRRAGTAGGTPVVGSVGCLAARKDYGTLLDALATWPAAGSRFATDLVGDGPERDPLEARPAALGLADRVRFLGERGDVDRCCEGLDVFVLSSREEGIPNALLEAMAAGRPSSRPPWAARPK